MSPASLLSPEPTRLQRLPGVSEALGAEVWLKREDETHGELGGGKLRKLAPLLADAAERGATHLLTLGAVGSNHLEATLRHGSAAGFEVIAAEVAYPKLGGDERAARLPGTTARNGDARQSGKRTLLSVRSEAHGVLRLGWEWLRLRARGALPYFIPPGGTCAASAPGCLEAGLELCAQMAAGALPGGVDAVFCVLGSGGTAAGLWAALSRLPGAPSLHAVRVYPSWLIGPTYLAWLARQGALRLQRAPERLPGLGPTFGPPWGPLVIDDSQLGSGYGCATAEGEAARALFAREGVALDLTYTAKAAAALMRHAAGVGRGKRLLLWYAEPRRSSKPRREAPPPPQRAATG